jgi:pyrroline-5-carboxylate reductase
VANANRTPKDGGPIGYDANSSESRSAALSANGKILLVGFGNMGQALVRGWLAKGRDAGSIEVIDPVPAARAVAATLGVAAHAEVAAATGRSEVVVLAVKPNQLAEVLPSCRAAAKGAVVLSIAAGKTIARLAAGLGDTAAIVRAMPNTPAAIGKAMTVLVANAAVTTAQRALCSELLAAVGAVAWLDDERHMDAVTAISGSGPAYVFLLIECLEQAARDLGLDAALAKQLAVATVAGAGEYAAAEEEPAAKLRRRVTSPNGTTQAALDVLMAEPGMRELLARAARAAADRSRELATA